MIQSMGEVGDAGEVVAPGVGRDGGEQQRRGQHRDRRERDRQDVVNPEPAHGRLRVKFEVRSSKSESRQGAVRLVSCSNFELRFELTSSPTSHAGIAWSLPVAVDAGQRRAPLADQRAVAEHLVLVLDAGPGVVRVTVVRIVSTSS